MQIAATLIVGLVIISSSASAQQKRDSVEARRKASGAQAQFESLRRQHLPRSNFGSSGECDARIGRFCQWNNEYDTVEAKQPRVIRRAREALIASLDSVAKKSPRDGWITGQRVRYLVEAKNDTAALRVARECQASRWWCDALEGLALHEGRHVAAADSAFARAIKAMPAAERCKWTDMTPILDASLRSKYGKVGCGRKEHVAERVWWLADPFWSVPGNDRRTEHFARHTMSKIQEPARNAYNLYWSSDLREMVVRYGWARYWTRESGTVYDPMNGPVSGHEATPNYHFIPVSLGTDTVPAVKFDLDMDASAERYSPVIARRVFEIDPQVAVFRRGDSAHVVVAYDVSARKELDSMSMAGALVLARDERSPMYVSPDTAGRKGTLSVTTDSRSHVLSLEVIDTVDGKGAAWKRTVLPIRAIKPKALALSDPLLFEPTDAEVGDLQAARATALGGNTVKRAKVGIYWETYGLARTDSAQPVSLTLTRVQIGTLRRLGESIGLASKSSPLTIRWNQFNQGSEVAARSVILDLALIPRGRYLLRIDAGSASSTRLLEII